MRIAVVGGGLYGCVAAIELARFGDQVALFEGHDFLLAGASRANQGRVHRGFHYPRSMDTASEAVETAPRFEARFFQCLDGWAKHYYAGAPDSKTPAQDYARFMERWPWSRMNGVEQPAQVANVEWCIRTRERFVDLDAVRDQLHAELINARVEVVLRQPFYGATRRAQRFDQVVYATYGAGLGRTLQWEVVEIALFKMPPELRDISLVVMDGDYCSIDPMLNGLHMLYDVKWSVHACNVGTEPVIPDELVPYIDRGPVRAPFSTRSDFLKESAARFMPLAAEGQYQYSLFTIRAVLPETDATDARPWLVDRTKRGIEVFPGKLVGCLPAADRVVALCHASQ